MAGVGVEFPAETVEVVIDGIEAEADRAGHRFPERGDGVLVEDGQLLPSWSEESPLPEVAVGRRAAEKDLPAGTDLFQGLEEDGESGSFGRRSPGAECPGQPGLQVRGMAAQEDGRDRVRSAGEGVNQEETRFVRQPGLDQDQGGLLFADQVPSLAAS